MVEPTVFSVDVVPDLVTAGVAAAARINQPSFSSASDVLFLAWRQAFLNEWAACESGMDKTAVNLAKKLAGDQHDRIVFRQPLYYQRDLSQHEWMVRDLVYSSAPFWFAAYYELVLAAIEACDSAEP